MTAFWIIAFIFLFCFTFTILFGAPYLPTLTPQVKTALDMASLKPGQTLIELGCGDGKMMIYAARQGINVIGYELNPLLVIVVWIRTLRYRKHAKVIWGNLWSKDWPPADAIFVFLLPRYMTKLDARIAKYPHVPVRLVSFAFPIKDKKPTATKNGVYAYDYR